MKPDEQIAREAASWLNDYYGGTRYCVTYDTQKYKTKAAAIEWIRDTLPKCKEPE